MIRIENLTKVFETPEGPVTAADHITMEVPDGEICILLGPSGCGKTTTLKMINRIIEPTSGRVEINGEDTSGLNTVDLRRGIGYVIQQIGLFPNMTIEENISVVPRLLGWDRQAHPRACKRTAGHGGPGSHGLHGPLPRRALRRPAAARRRDPCPGRSTAGAADGRALRRHRPDQPRGDPG
ncbi:MAG: ATP-binding cassette domain-containing protein [Arhodomonas sp.]|nr:ATP-binding cassette domain-containing protein [Arhodomonas sp.]